MQALKNTNESNAAPNFSYDKYIQKQKQFYNKKLPIYMNR